MSTHNKRVNIELFNIFIPSYNEEKNIAEVIQSIKRIYPEIKIYVVNDGSTDNTKNVALNEGAIVIDHPTNLGQGAAIRTAFEFAIDKNVKYIVTLDADGQHDPKELPGMFIKMSDEEADLIIGSRFIDDKEIKMKKYREFGILFLSRIFSIIHTINLTDITSGYRIYEHSMIKTILPFLKEEQYYAIEVLKEIIKHKGKIIEVPVEDIQRKHGKSKKRFLKYAFKLIRITLKE